MTPQHAQASAPFYKRILSVINPYTLATLMALLAVYTSILALVLRDGINHHFYATIWAYAWALAAIFGLTAYLTRKKIPQNPKDQTFDFSVAWLLLLPLTPVTQYAIRNQGTLTALDTIFLLGISLIVGTVLILLIPYALKRWIPLFVSVSLGTALYWLFTYMPIMAYEYKWIRTGLLSVQLPTLVAATTLLMGLYFVRRSFLYPLVIVFFISNSVLAFFQDTGENNMYSSTLTSEQREKMIHPLEEELKNIAPKKTPNIYMLVYDSYIGNETMLQYGIDNSAQERFLKDSGFTFYPHNYSIGRASLSSMSHVLSMTPIDPAHYRIATSGDAAGLRMLRNHGYRTYASLFSYFFSPYITSYYTPLVGYDEDAKVGDLYPLLKAIQEGQFRFDVGNGAVKSITGKKNAVILESTDAPKFLYTHTGPFHSQNSGQCLPDENELFEDRLKTANAQMRADVTLIEDNDPNAIIIVMGDHGPYLTKDCLFLKDIPAEEINRLDMQDRFGTFLAIRWPNGYNKHTNKIKTIQHVMPAIFANMYDDPRFFDHLLSTDLVDDSAVQIKDGIIKGGPNDGQPLFLHPNHIKTPRRMH